MDPGRFETALAVYLMLLAANQNGFVPFLKQPVSIKYLGPNKTVGAYLFGPLLAGVMGLLITWYYGSALIPTVLGALWAGLGAVLGDHVKSFFKRRQGIQPGDLWWPWDRVDYVFGGLTALLLVGAYWDMAGAVLMVMLALAINPIGNRLGYHLKIKKSPY